METRSGFAGIDGAQIYYETVDYLDLPPAAMVGLSMGGGIVTSFAVKYPTATRALVAINSGLWGYQFSKEFDARFGAITRSARATGVTAAKALWLADALFAPANESPAVKEKLRKIVDDYSGWHWLNHDPERGMNPPTIARLGEIRVPTLAVLGERDLPDFHQIAKILTEKISGGHQVSLAGAGHMANMEAPREFNEVVLEFLAKV